MANGLPSISSPNKPFFSTEPLGIEKATTHAAVQTSQVSAVSNSLGSGQLVTRVFEYGRTLLESTQSIGPIFTPLAGVSLGLRLEGSLHSKASPLIKNNPFRYAGHLQLEQLNPMHKIVWTQTGGVIELGTGLNGTVPPLYFVGLQFGFNPSALIRYRCTKPHVLSLFENTNSALMKNSTSFPFTANNAKGLPTGSEFELSGMGRLRLSAALAANLGTPVNTILNAGVGASAYVEYTTAKEIVLNILGLDGENRVRVTLKKFADNIAEAGAKAYAGITANVDSMLPKVGEGILSYPLAMLNGVVSQKVNGFYSCFSAKAATTSKDSEKVIATFDFDLSDPRAMKAFDELLKLSTQGAETLSALKNGPVRSLKSSEKNTEDKDEFSMTLFGDVLCLYQALHHDQNGHFTSPDDKTTLFHKTQFQKHESSWFQPTRNVLWQSVSLSTPHNNQEKTFYRFCFEKSGKFESIEYSDYFGLATALSLDGKEASSHHHKAGKLDQDCRRILCESPEVKQITDIYFTSEGIENIKSTNFIEARKAYLKAMGTIRKDYEVSFLVDSHFRAVLVPIIKSYIAELKLGWFFNFGHSKRISDLETSYEALSHRSLHMDAMTYTNAKIFAESVTQLKHANNPREIEAFFVGIGKSKGFRYKCWIGALAILAGDNETLIHKHEMSTEGIAFKYNDEGKLEEPSEIVADLLSRHL